MLILSIGVFPSVYVMDLDEGHEGTINIKRQSPNYHSSI